MELGVSNVQQRSIVGSVGDDITTGNLLLILIDSQSNE
jgi:hypothetical protein